MSAYLPDGSTNEDGGKYDAGHGMRYTPRYTDPECTQLEGITFWHPCKQDRHPDFEGWANGRTGESDTPGTGWTHTNTDNPERLTVSPSILCVTCGFHGFLVEGRWEPC
ncbi:hypothetical protein [Rhodococcus sp. B7740]|uniref:hypothetical protein n=1 Tax=Rhodococcus sp. B7740 TaxID=1564114 RepID=UPI0005EACD7F|nr:hypothetical protein [Rhodococcus sp. B7740]